MEKAIPHQLRNYPISKKFEELKDTHLRDEATETARGPPPERQDNDLKTSRAGTPTKESGHLEDLQVDEDHDVNTRHSSDKSPA
jgi:hypothetical protein